MARHLRLIFLKSQMLVDFDALKAVIDQYNLNCDGDIGILLLFHHIQEQTPSPPKKTVELILFNGF